MPECGWAVFFCRSPKKTPKAHQKRRRVLKTAGGENCKKKIKIARRLLQVKCDKVPSDWGTFTISMNIFSGILQKTAFILVFNCTQFCFDFEAGNYAGVRVKLRRSYGKLRRSYGKLRRSCGKLRRSSKLNM